MTNPLFDRLSLLSEPTRVRMLRVLAREELAVGELARVVQTSQPTVSRHLKHLARGGWVEQRKVGTATWVRLSRELTEPDQRLWTLVDAEIEADATEESSIYAEDLRRLEVVLAQREGDSASLFRRLGSRWEAVRTEQFGSSYVLPAALALLPQGLRAVDLGCGTGELLELLAPACAEVVGVDREEAMLDVARARVSDHTHVRLEKALLDALPLESATMDLATCVLVLHHIRELAPVFAEARRILRPGGRWVVVDMAAHDREDFRRSMGHAHGGFSEDRLADLAETAGLQLTRWSPLPPDPSAQGPGLFVAVLQPGN